MKKHIKLFEEFNNQSIDVETFKLGEKVYVNRYLRGYLEAALWTEEEQLTEDSKTDKLFTIEDLSEECINTALIDVNNFVEKAGDLLKGLDPDQVGHDFWLTRNGHGAGFWDRGLGEVGDKLTELSKEMGAKDLLLGDDGQIYFM